jgi:rubredoxin
MIYKYNGGIDMSEKRYTEVGESGKCPRCKHSGLEYGDRESDSDWLALKFVCPHCGLEGEEVYVVSYSHHDIVVGLGD